MIARLAFQSHPDVLAVALFCCKSRLQSRHDAAVGTCNSRELLLSAFLSRWATRRDNTPGVCMYVRMSQVEQVLVLFLMS